MKILFAMLFAISASSFANEMQESSPRLMVHLLDYIGVDYPGAVDKGKIISKGEFDEMKEFTKTLIELNGKFPETKSAPGLAADLESLDKAVKAMSSNEAVMKIAQDAKWKIVAVTGMTLSPNLPPNLHRAKKLYGENCTQCHGATGHGDGPNAADHDPRPSSFHDGEKMAKFSPFQAFNAIRLGVPGTAMAAHTAFSDSEIWDLSFYVLSLRHGDISPVKVAPTEVSLHQIASLSDEQLLPLISGDTAEKKQHSLAAIRTYSSKGEDSRAFLDLARSSLNEAGTDYRAQNFESAKRKALIAYLNGIEPVEPRIRANDSALLMEIEERMGAVRSSIEKREEASEVDAKVGLALETITKVENTLDRKTSPAMTFSISAGIVLREAFEAIFLLIALLGIIRTVGNPKAAFFVHLGWTSAIGVGVIMWFFSGWVMSMSGAGRETLEGAVSLIAVGVVLYMGFWLHRKTEMGRWRAFLDEMTKTALSGKKLLLLTGVAFMAVFREAFETVLFLRAVLLESGGGHQAALVGGVLSAFFAVVILTIALVHFSAKLPVRKLFDLSAIVMIVLAFVLMGKAVHSFQEAGYISVTPFPLSLRMDLFGIYPSYESIIPQLIILAISISFWMAGKRPVAHHCQA